jgi:hypothetical protein
MNLSNFKELEAHTYRCQIIGNYELRKYRESDNYVLVDAIGDFIVIDNDSLIDIAVLLTNQIKVKN